MAVCPLFLDTRQHTAALRLLVLGWLLLGFGTESSLEMRHFRRFQLGLPMPNGALYLLQELAPGQWRLQADANAMRTVMAVQ